MFVYVFTLRHTKHVEKFVLQTVKEMITIFSEGVDCKRIHYPCMSLF